MHHAEHTLATDRYNFDKETAYQAVAMSVRDYLVESLRDTKAHYLKEDPKRVYYLSLEFLMGRSLLNALMNLDLTEPYREALEEIGYSLEVRFMIANRTGNGVPSHEIELCLSGKRNMLQEQGHSFAGQNGFQSK